MEKVSFGEPKCYRTVTGFAQTEEEAKVVQVSSCPPGLLGQWCPGTGPFRLQSMEQSLIPRQSGTKTTSQGDPPPRGVHIKALGQRQDAGTRQKLGLESSVQSQRIEEGGRNKI